MSIPVNIASFLSNLTACPRLGTLAFTLLSPERTDSSPLTADSHDDFMSQLQRVWDYGREVLDHRPIAHMTHGVLILTGGEVSETERIVDKWYVDDDEGTMLFGNDYQHKNISVNLWRDEILNNYSGQIGTQIDGNGIGLSQWISFNNKGPYETTYELSARTEYFASSFGLSQTPLYELALDLASALIVDKQYSLEELGSAMTIQYKDARESLLWNGSRWQLKKDSTLLPGLCDGTDMFNIDSNSTAMDEDLDASIVSVIGHKPQEGQAGGISMWLSSPRNSGVLPLQPKFLSAWNQFLRLITATKGSSVGNN